MFFFSFCFRSRVGQAGGLVSHFPTVKAKGGANACTCGPCEERLRDGWMEENRNVTLTFRPWRKELNKKEKDEEQKKHQKKGVRGIAS